MTALQVVDGQDIVIVLDDGDAACRELALEHLGLLRIDVVQEVGGVDVLAARESQRILVAQDLLATLIDQALAEGATVDSGFDSGNLVADVFGHEQHVVAG